MDKPRRTKLRFEPVLAMHPAEAALVRRLLLGSPSFRELCEDYLLVRKMIADARAQATPDRAATRDDYARLAVDLEHDIARALASARTGQPP